MAEAALSLLYTIQNERLGGAELHAIDLARRMALRGHSVTAVCRPGASAVLDALTAAAPLRSVRCADTYPEMAALIDELRPQLVQHFNTIVTPAALQIARHKPRSVQIIHANHALERSRPSPTEASDWLVAVSASAATHHPEREGGPPLRVIENGIDTRHFTPADRAPSSPPIRLLSVGRLDEAAKRTAALIELCCGLPDELDWRLTLVGDGRDRDSIARLVRDRGLANVDLVGHCDDPAPHYRTAHVFLSYSTSEGFGRSLAEAASAGLAIVARHCHGLSTALEKAQCARIVHSDAEFASTLREVIGDAGLRSALGRAARRYAVEHLDVERMVIDYESLYRELVW